MMSCVRLPQVQAPPLSTPQLWVLVLALTLGPRQACRQCGIAPPTLRSWLAQLQEGAGPLAIRGCGLPRGVWPWRTGRLAQWLLVQREQQQQGGPDVLLQVARTLLGGRSSLNHQLAWTAHFLLRHDLALDSLETLDPLDSQQPPELDPHQTPNLDPLDPQQSPNLDPQALDLLQPSGLASRGHLPRTVLDRSRAFIHLLDAQVGFDQDHAQLVPPLRSHDLPKP